MTMLQRSNGIKNICLTLSGLIILSTGSVFAQDEKADEHIDISAPEIGSDEFDTFNIQVQDTELVKVLEMLALQAERNIIPSRNVAAVVSVNLFDVTFDEALDAILTPNGFAFEESSNGKFIYVYTQEELERKRQLERKTEARMFELEHLSAGDAGEFAAPLLSERGKLSFIGDVEGGIERDFTDMGRDDWAHSAILVVNDYPENLASIADLLGEIDTPPKQVVIDATIASVQVNEADGFGVDFSVIADLNYSGLLNPMSVVSDMLRGNKEPPAGYNPNVPTPVTNDGQAFGLVSTAGNVTEGPSTFKLGVMAGDASVFIRALDQVTDAVILARPRLMALNRQRAQVLVGRREPYLTTTSTDTTTTQTVQYLDTGVKLMFRPFISKDGSIRMELYPSVSKATRVDVSQGLNTVSVPQEDTNEISTNVRVNDGETLVLGGLFEEKTTITNRQVPFLGDIPIVGAAFKGYDNEVLRREIIFLITPTIVHDDLIRRSGEVGKEFVRQLRVGTREGLLPWARERRSAQHNQDALQAMNEGDFELAMFHVDNSLRLNPAQPKMRNLRSQITEDGDQDYYDADMWSSALTGMVNDHRKLRDEPEAQESPEPQPNSEPEASAPDVQESAADSVEPTVETADDNTAQKTSPAVAALLAEIEGEDALFDENMSEPALAFNEDKDKHVFRFEDTRSETEAMPEVAEVNEEASPEATPEMAEVNEEASPEAMPEMAEVIEDASPEAMPEMAEVNEDASPEAMPEVAEVNEEASTEAMSVVAEENEVSPTEAMPEMTEVNEEASPEAMPEVAEVNEEASPEAMPEVAEVNEEASPEAMAEVAEVNEESSIEAMPEVAEENETLQIRTAQTKAEEIAAVDESSSVETPAEAPRLAPLESAWLRVWWLAELASEDANAFAMAGEKARQMKPAGTESTESTAVAEVIEDEE